MLMKILTRMLLKAIPVVCAASAAVGGGCSDEREDRTLDQIALSRNTVIFSVKGGTTAVSVAAPDAWSAQTAATWIDLRQEGTTLTVTADPNDETLSVREAVIEIASGEEKASLTVRQEPAEPVSVTIKTSDTHEIDSEGGTFTVAVSAESDWNASLQEPVEGWRLTVDKNTGICQIHAAANGGEAKNGTILVTAGSEKLNHKEMIAVRQISRAENIYYKFTGDWDMYAPAWTMGKTPAGQGVYAACTIGEIDYPTDKLGMYELMIRGSSLEMLEVDRKSGKCTFPLGYLIGATVANGYEFYLYLVALDLDAGKYATGDIYGVLSDDGQTIRIEQMPGSFNQLGLIGYNVYQGYTFFNNLYYASGPGIELRRSQTQSVPKFSSMLGVSLPGTLPEGICERLPKNIVGECRLWQAEETDKL